MRDVTTTGALLDQVNRRKAYGKFKKYPSIPELRAIWALGQQTGRIVILEGPQPGDASGTAIGLIVSGAAGQLIRVALSHVEAQNLARALLDGC